MIVEGAILGLTFAIVAIYRLSKQHNREDIGQKGFTELMWACETGDEQLLRKLLVKGENVNQTDDDGTTPLMYAAQYGHKNCLTALLEHGAKVSPVNKKGKTAYMYAKKERHEVIEKILHDWMEA